MPSSKQDDPSNSGLSWFFHRGETFLVIVNKDGTVKRADVVHGDPALVDVAKKAVMKWRYKPSTIDGKPVEGATTAKLTFQLGNH
jgi:outer membrane biosynthesis protein TonB